MSQDYKQLSSNVSLPDRVVAYIRMAWVPYALLCLLIVVALQVLVVSTLFLVHALFPNGRFVPGWSRVVSLLYVPVAGIALLLNDYLLPATDPDSDWGLLLLLILVIQFPVSIGLQYYRYRYVSSARQRQQTKWYVFGIAVAAASMVVLVPLIVVAGPSSLLGQLAISLQVLGRFYAIVMLAVALLYSRLYDIDVIVNRALVYGILSAMMSGIYFGSVVLLQQVFRPLLGFGSEPAIVVSTLAIAALFNPLSRGIQCNIDRRFYRHKYNAAQTLAAFGRRLCDEVDLDSLHGEIERVIDETLRPAHVSLWLRETQPSPRENMSNATHAGNDITPIATGG